MNWPSGRMAQDKTRQSLKRQERHFPLWTLCSLLHGEFLHLSANCFADQLCSTFRIASVLFPAAAFSGRSSEKPTIHHQLASRQKLIRSWLGNVALVFVLSLSGWVCVRNRAGQKLLIWCFTVTCVQFYVITQHKVRLWENNYSNTLLYSPLGVL